MIAARQKREGKGESGVDGVRTIGKKWSLLQIGLTFATAGGDWLTLKVLAC
jgi:hypothetical protein